MAIHPEFSFTHVLSGFSAALDASSVSLLERDSAVQGIYPVRVAYPASVSSDALEQRSLASAVGNADLSLPGYDGRGVTIALLDTGVDRLHPSLVGSVSRGIDIVDPSGDATAQAPPGRPGDVERHGTELAGILVGDRGPAVSHGIARGASVLPIRVAGWQTDGRGRLRRVLAHGSADRGARARRRSERRRRRPRCGARRARRRRSSVRRRSRTIPAARAVAGAVGLDTLVVAPAGNDGPAGPGFGSISGPGGSPAALTVGAADMRAHIQHVRVSLRSGLELVLDRHAAAHRRARAPARVHHRSRRARASSGGARISPGSTRTSPRTVSASSPVARRSSRPAALPPRPPATRRGQARRPCSCTARGFPRAACRSTRTHPCPSSRFRPRSQRRLLSAIAHGQDAGVSIGDGHGTLRTTPRPSVATFSSTGLAYDGRVKPDVVSSGVGIATAEPTAGTRIARRGTEPSTDRAPRPPPSPVLRRCSRRRGPHSARRICAACSSEVRAGCREPR